jgi:hypothetical protein
VVDVTLIDEWLAMTPEQRLLQNDHMVRTIQELRDAFAAHESHDAPADARGDED